MTFARIALAAALLSSLAATGASAKPPCFKPEAMRAAQMRQLHIQLQVASLNCRSGFPEMPGQYAAYIQRFNAALASNAKVLEGHFGGRNSAQMDRFMTSLANEESQRAHTVADYCENHAPLFEKLMAMKPHEMEGFATHHVSHPVATACAAEKPIKAAEQPAAPAPKKVAAKAPAG